MRCGQENIARLFAYFMKHSSCWPFWCLNMHLDRGYHHLHMLAIDWLIVEHLRAWVALSVDSHDSDKSISHHLNGSPNVGRIFQAAQNSEIIFTLHVVRQVLFHIYFQPAANCVQHTARSQTCVVRTTSKVLKWNISPNREQIEEYMLISRPEWKHFHSTRNHVWRALVCVYVVAFYYNGHFKIHSFCLYHFITMADTRRACHG